MSAPDRMIQDRFLKYVEPELNSGCWLWSGGLTGKGYGMFNIERRSIKSHRAAWVTFRGQIPRGLCVLHRCDTPSCVNPDHLFLGTKADNNADMLAKGRHRSVPPRGSRHPRAKLTEQDVRDIRAAYVPYKMSCLRLAKQYGVNPRQLENIIHRKSWTHV